MTVAESIVEEFYGTADLTVRRADCKGEVYTFIYMQGMIDTEHLERAFIIPLTEAGAIMSGVQPREVTREEAISAVSSGECLMLKEVSEKYTVLPIRMCPGRGVAEPPTSTVVKGPREGFTEDIKTNIVLLRRRLRSNKLVVATEKVGRFSETEVAVVYLKGVADETLVRRITEKIRAIDIDGIVDSSYIAKLLEARAYSLFKQTGSSEKPDIVSAKLLEGRVAIVVDGSPIALTLPFLFWEDFQDSQDYFKRNVRASFLRIIRLCAVFFAMLLPAVFVAVQTHQFQMLPLKLLLAVLSNVQGIPFTPVVEMFIALALFEILAEAAVRMPRYVGMATSIVGAIVLGSTAVEAGVLSSITVLITAMSGIGLYAIPDEVGTFSMLRLLFVVVAGLTGIYGIVLLSMGLLAYLVTLEVYGAPYLAPFAPIIKADLKDAFFKADLAEMTERPRSLNNQNKRRFKR